MIQAKSLEELSSLKPKAREVCRRYMDKLDNADVDFG
jgi:hypothetical protein